MEPRRISTSSTWSCTAPGTDSPGSQRSSRVSIPVPGSAASTRSETPGETSLQGTVDTSKNSSAGFIVWQGVAHMIDSQLVEAFRRDGVVLLEGLLSAEEVATLAAGVDRNLHDISPLGINATRPGEPGAFVEDFRNWQRIPEYEQIVRSPALARAAAALMEARQVRLFHDHLLVKEAGTRDPSPWHQDQPYYSIDGAQTVSFWIPLDPVERPSALEFVAGSHDGRWYMPRSF